VALGTTAFSEDGKYLAYCQSQSGSDWNTIKLMDVEELKELPDALDWVKFSSIAWLHSGEGFFYCRYPKPKKFEARKKSSFISQELICNFSRWRGSI
jgi:prolyl oligopeptidase